MWCTRYIYMSYNVCQCHFSCVGWGQLLAWCYAITLEVSQALGQILFRGQCCWNNFSMWNKQTAHWLCSLLSDCINRPSHHHQPFSYPFSLSLWSTSWSVLQSKFKQIGHQSAGDVLNLIQCARIHVKPSFPFLYLSHIHPNKHVTCWVTLSHWTNEAVSF